MKRKTPSRKIGVYAGSFDPITQGHMDVVRNAVGLFDKLIIAVGINPDKAKSQWLTLDEKLRLIRQCVQDFPNIEVTYFVNQYLVNYAASVGAGYIVRGERNVDDFISELAMHNINKRINPEIRTVYFKPERKYTEVSSRTVRGLIGPVGWRSVVKEFVPTPVFEFIKQKESEKRRKK